MKKRYYLAEGIVAVAVLAMAISIIPDKPRTAEDFFIAQNRDQVRAVVSGLQARSVNAVGMLR